MMTKPPLQTSLIFVQTQTLIAGGDSIYLTCLITNPATRKQLNISLGFYTGLS